LIFTKLKQSSNKSTIMRKLIIFGIALIALQKGYSQRVGVGTTDPKARFAVDSSIMLDQVNYNQGNLSSGALLFGSDQLVGITRSTVNGSGARNGIGFYTFGARRMIIDSIGRVGIGTTVPAQRLHVEGNIYTSGNIGVGVSNPNFDLHVGNSARIGGSLGIGIDPSFSYKLLVTGDSYFQNSNVGINIAPSSTYSLYTAGNVRFTDAVRFDGIVNPNNSLTIGNNTSIDGSLTVGGSGIVRGSGSAQWRLVRLTVGYAGPIAGNSDIIGAALAYNLGGATLAGVFVGPIVEAGAGSSNLMNLGLVATNISNTGCRFLIMNGSSSSADMGSVDNPTRWQLTLLVFD
jgi:hypothetical protein